MIRTVLGDVRPDDFGPVDYHEHAFQASPLLPDDDLDDLERSTDEFRQLAESGFDAVVDATPIGLGRRPGELVSLSDKAGIAVVATTGLHREAHYGPSHWLRALTTEQLSASLVADVVVGMPALDTEDAVKDSGARILGARAGMLKAGIDYWRISASEQRTLEAVGQAHAATNAPVMVHLEHASAAFEVLSLLDGVGVVADAVVLAHIDRAPDPGLHAELAAAGAYLGYDGWARTMRWPDSVLLNCLVRTAEEGGADRILIGGDVARRSRYLAYGGMPGLRYLGDRVLPRLRSMGGDELSRRVTIANPARYLDRF